MNDTTPTRAVHAKAPTYFGGWTNAPLTTQADSFEIARADVTREFLILSDAQTIRYAAALAEDADVTPEVRAEAYTRLHRAYAPLALKAAVAATAKRSSPGFDTAWSSSMISLWLVIKRWNPTKGFRLSSFITLTLPVELERQIREQELLTRSAWKRIAVSTAAELLLDQRGNQPYLTWYADCQLDLTEPSSPGFPEATSVTWKTTTHGMLMTLREPERDEGTISANRYLTWMTNSKTPSSKRFFGTRLNKPRVTQKSTTGYKVTELRAAREQLTLSLKQHPKLVSTAMKTRIFARPPRPLRRDDLTPRMIQDAIRRHRFIHGTAFDEKAWSIHAIAALMDELYREVSLNAPVNDDSAATLVDFLAAPEPVDDDETLPEAEFDDLALEDACEIIASLQKSGLWEIAMSMPIHKFLIAHRAHRAGFCTLCSRYGLRVKHALQIMNVIEAHLR